MHQDHLVTNEPLVHSGAINCEPYRISANLAFDPIQSMFAIEEWLGLEVVPRWPVCGLKMDIDGIQDMQVKF